MALKKITLRDKKIFDKYLGVNRHDLAVYCFSSIYIWKGLFEICWEILDGCLCVFFKDSTGCFLYLAPQGKSIDAGVIARAFRIMDSFNRNPDISRIENIEEKDTAFYRGLGYAVREKSGDYLCQRAGLVNLKGNQFKSKRACVNYFLKNYSFECAPLSPKDRKECLNLYSRWMRGRKDRNQDKIYRGMLEDSRVSLENALKGYAKLDFIGRVVKIENGIRAFTVGYPLNAKVFCILYEIADLSVKGLAQFIFQEFCREMKEYRYVNIMDDSGLENLKKVKLSYHPLRIIPAYIATRKNA